MYIHGRIEDGSLSVLQYACASEGYLCLFKCLIFFYLEFKNKNDTVFDFPLLLKTMLILGRKKCVLKFEINTLFRILWVNRYKQIIQTLADMTQIMRWYCEPQAVSYFLKSSVTCFSSENKKKITTNFIYSFFI